ncbi:MAG: phosphoglucosamine mutase [Clostridia bacterium]|nr:phosphoglucosamine mutase [Clostridia bacterium]
MGLFFGTDGLRGRVNEDLTQNIAYKIGNALSILKENPTIIIGSDTRVSNTYLTLGVASGAMSGGARVIDVGVVPTAGIAYLTKKCGADYGIVISASHNSGEYNGIKVFNSDGYKLSDKEEERIERCFIREKINDFPNIGVYEQDFNLVKPYKKFLIDASEHRLDGLTIVVDGAYGAAHRIAPDVFRKLGANVIAANCVNDGLKINENCGALYPENLVKRVFRYKADMGFAFDGDSDRLIAVDENGKIIDGDMIIWGLAKYFKKIGRLNSNTVVGTSHTNMAIEEDLKREGINLIRTDIGDKYVLAKLIEKNLTLGGEQSGHIIIKDLATTGDGILAAIILANMVINEKTTLSQALKIDLYPQVNKNVVVEDKFRIMNNEELGKAVAKFNAELGGGGRLMIRASGTEPKIRVMVESKNKAENEDIANSIVSLIKRINAEV